MEPGARALLHANQPSLRLPAALPPSPASLLRAPTSRLRRSLLSSGPAAAAARFLLPAFPRVLPAAGERNPSTAAAFSAGRGPRAAPPPRAGPSAHSPSPLGLGRPTRARARVSAPCLRGQPRSLHCRSYWQLAVDRTPWTATGNSSEFGRPRDSQGWGQSRSQGSKEGPPDRPQVPRPPILKAICHSRPWSRRPRPAGLLRVAKVNPRKAPRIRTPDPSTRPHCTTRTRA